MGETKVVKTIFKDFCESTTIHGIYHLHNSKAIFKFFWFLIVLSMLCSTAWFCLMSITRYLRYDIKTMITYDTQTRLDFPAITFCNQFPIIRSFVGSNDQVLLDSIIFLTEKLKDVPNVYRQSQKTCKSSKSPYDNVTAKDLFEMGLTQSEKLFAQDSLRSVKKCWWASNEFNCKGSFMNHVLDRGDCFTFIPTTKASRFIQYSDYKALFYGVNISDIADRYVVNSGPKSALQLLMNVNQHEHCDASRIYEGAGFQAVIHDPANINIIFSMASAINLQPGFVIDVALKPTVFERQTAFLGLCNTSVYNFEQQSIYFKNICSYFCYYKRIIKVCGCVGRNALPGIDEILNSLYGMIVNDIRSCSDEDAICMKQQQYETYLSSNLQENCPECLQPCLETKYEILVTMKKFTSNSLINVEFNMTETRKNFILVNFFFDSLNTITVVESQDFTLQDLFIYIGGVIGLFLGMSFMSIGDIFQVLSLCLFIKVSSQAKNLQTKMKIGFNNPHKSYLTKRRNAVLFETSPL